MLYVFILGTVIGSFLNVCIYRLPIGKSIVNPPSTCGNCKTRLKAKDLIPILSWILLRGKCGYCSCKISARYPFVEGLTGFLFVLTYIGMGFNYALIFGWIFVSYALVVAFIDYDHHKIHNKSVLFGMLISLIYIIAKALYFGNLVGVIDGFKGMALGFVTMLALTVISGFVLGSKGIGFGDVKIYLPLGLLMGVKYILFSIWLMFIISGFVAVVYRVKKGKKAKTDPIALGPMIMLSAYVCFLYVY